MSQEANRWVLFGAAAFSSTVVSSDILLPLLQYRHNLLVIRDFDPAKVNDVRTRLT
jgi:hypothetical protein